MGAVALRHTPRASNARGGWNPTVVSHAFNAVDDGQRVLNLHDAEIPNRDGPTQAIKHMHDPSITSGNTRAIFRDHARVLKEEIMRSQLVLGCVAWFTQEDILTALRTPEFGASIVVQKEDFLRCDEATSHKPSWEKSLRKLYNSLHCGVDRYTLPGVANRLSYCSDPSVNPVRCVGNHNAAHQPAAPRMHNKFSVFCKVEEKYDEVHDGTWLEVKPYAVWTGSMNWSNNAGRSFENAVLIYDAKIASAYAEEFGNIFALSEPLDWTSSWVAPQYRIGS